MFSPNIFFFSNKRKEKKRNVEEGKELSFKLLLCALSLLVPTFNLPLLPFYFKCFLLTFSSFQVEEKKDKEKKKMQRREGVFLQALAMTFHFWLPFLPFYFKRFLVTSSFS
jgi:hypothetical protein